MSERLLRQIAEDENGCWIWQGYVHRSGYGRAWWNGRKVYAHRAMYEALRGEIPDRFDLDHLCRVRSCVNPAHLEAVTRSENLRRGAGPAVARMRGAAVTHCRKGHPFDEANTYVTPRGRACRECHRAASRAWKHRRKETVA